MCGTAVSVLLFLLWSLVEVHSQTTPYLTFMGEILPNHSYVNLSLVGDYAIYNEVVCHTDLDTCCNNGYGPDRGDWYFPNGDRLPFPGSRHPLFERRLHQGVELYRGDESGSAPSGIYRCDIETIAVNSDNNTDRETVYVGLYESGGDHSIIIIHSDIVSYNIILFFSIHFSFLFNDFSLSDVSAPTGTLLSTMYTCIQANMLIAIYTCIYRS